MNFRHLLLFTLNRLFGRALIALTVILSTALSAATALPRAYADEGNIVSVEGTPTAAPPPAELATPPAPMSASADNAELRETDYSAVLEFHAVPPLGSALPPDKPAAEGDSSAEDKVIFGSVSSAGHTSRVVQLSAGKEHTCARTQNGSVFCWGSMPERASVVPRPVLGLSGVVELVSNGDHTCARLVSGRVVCWGGNNEGQLGDASQMKAATPQFVSQLSGAAGLAAGHDYTCARTRSGQVFCWGNNYDGQLGVGSRGRGVHAPTKPVTLSNVTGMAAGKGHTCAVTSNGSAYCWGNNLSGQLGIGIASTDRYSSPQQVVNLSDVASMAAGNSHTCARKISGQLYCWGSGLFGQLGNGSTNSFSTPQLVSLTSHVAEVVAGDFHTCARTAQGEVFCWGHNNEGQLGNGQTAHVVTQPQQVLGLPANDPAIAIAAGSYHTCAATQSGLVYCWGRNRYGQLGNGTTSWNPVTLPVRVAGTPSLPEPRQVFLPIMHTRP